MRLFIIGLSLILLAACSSKERAVINKVDYDKYLSTNSSDKVQETKKELEFWNAKIKTDSIQLTALSSAASVYNALFKQTHDVSYLKNAEQCLFKNFETAAIKKEYYALALAQNYITQHRFKEAKQLLQAYEKEFDLKPMQWVLFDVNMELGNYALAEENLNNFKDFTDFNYLTRLAKFSDYKGNLDATIAYMEKALEKAESSKNSKMLLWTYTNLGDYYGHQGEIKKSYESYLKALALDPYNVYAKKGIAWIAFSHEKDPNEAFRILNLATEEAKAPDHYLLLSEIAGTMNDEFKSDEYLNAYLKLVADEQYGDMYNNHSSMLLLDELNDVKRAKVLAMKEVENRPTPATYSLLAYSYLKEGNNEQALNIINEKVVGKTFEPAANLIVAKIYKANNKTGKVKELKEDLIASLFELGPTYKEEIKNL